MAKKSKFDALYSGIETIEGSTVLYTNKGEYSVIMQIQNPIEKFCADIDAYYNFSDLMTSLIKSLGEGYSIQKQDIFSRQKYSKKLSGNEDFLTKEYFKYYEGREYTEVKTFLIITQERKNSKFLQFDKRKWKEFHLKLQKVYDLFQNRKVACRKLNEREIEDYLYRYLSFHFQKGTFSVDNFRVNDHSLKIGQREIRCLSVVDVDEVNLPSEIRPYIVEAANGNEMPQDIMSFLTSVPGADCIIYNQVIIIPVQRSENSKLTKKKNRHSSLPDPSNDLAVQDIIKVQEDIARNGKLLVYAHYNIIVSAFGNLDQSCNYIENALDKAGITISKSSYNQLELFISSFPGHAYSTNPDYDRFLTLHDAALCLFYKERIKGDEETPLKIYYTDRQGVPIAIDITGKEGKMKLTTNSNFFSLGPSGSGKSFHMNSVVRQLVEQGTDVIMVDTGNSYEGICNYFRGTYISYTEEKPITMNPFKITQREYNIEKIDFLKSLIFLLWKGADGIVTQVEDRLISMVISEYYASYFTGGTIDQSQLLETMRNDLMEKKLEEGKDHSIAKQEVEVELREEQVRLAKAKDQQHVSSLSFNSFYEFACDRIPSLCAEKRIPFDIDSFKFILEAFYKGGEFERTLNDDFDNSLFDEQFIVFEIDAIKDHKILFPIVTLIIMDVFIQKMRIKKNRKALIIEEAWKAIASPLMADYIKYLYKTVRKFWGIVGVVTQELNDIIGNKVVKDAIINNSEITILLDQSKFKERYTEIAQLLGLSEVECRKIWTINSLDNRENRSFFKEVYVRRGNRGDVFGVEEPPHCYITYTTERVEKDGFKTYLNRYSNVQEATERFCADWKRSGCKSAMEFVTKHIAL